MSKREKKHLEMRITKLEQRLEAIGNALDNLITVEGAKVYDPRLKAPINAVLKPACRCSLCTQDCSGDNLKLIELIRYISREIATKIVRQSASNRAERR